MGGEVVLYSEALKLQVLEELEQGRWKSASEAAEAYGIGGANTVVQWARKYGKGHLLRKVVRVDREEEPRELKRLKERVRQLEGALADAHMDRALNQAFFEQLCRQVKVDPEEFKKKVGGKPSTKRGSSWVGDPA
jgi:transposase